MKRLLKWLAVVVAIVAALLAAAAYAGVYLSEQKRHRTVALPAYALPIPTDAASIERGKYLYATRGCAECHGADGAGRDVVNDGKGFHVRGPNITAGPGNVVDGYTPADWERALRHGVARGGRPLLVMPAEDYARLTDVDLGAVVAYLRSLPPAAGGAAILELPLPVRVLYGYGAITDAAAKIDHALPPPQPVPEGITVEHGKYVSAACIGCHGEHLSGGKIPGGPPDWPPASNLTPGPDSAMARYANAAQFAQMLRSGTRPDGTPIKVMPFEALKQMNNTDIAALYLYLKTVPARPAGQR